MLSLGVVPGNAPSPEPPRISRDGRVLGNGGCAALPPPGKMLVGVAAWISFETNWYEKKVGSQIQIKTTHDARRKKL
jgi:hypothetical protein